MFDTRNNLSHQVADEIREHLGEYAYKTVIPRNVRLSECPSFGKPIILYDNNSSGAVSYRALAKEFIQRRLSKDSSGKKTPTKADEWVKV
jgi:chromosome partitioning protein